ncbi:MAG: hypothetical protein R2771_15390 [Saprospiraceae bacterium]
MNKLIFIFLSFFLIGCYNNEKTEREIQEEYRTRIENVNKEFEEKQIQKIVDEYQIKYCWDTMNYEFSIEYDTIINSGIQLIEDMTLIDVFRIDSIVYLKTECHASPNIYFNLATSNPTIWKEIINKKDKNSLSYKYIFIVKIHEIKKVLFEYDVYEGDFDEYIECSASLEDSENFVGYGELIGVQKIFEIE